MIIERVDDISSVASNITKEKMDIYERGKLWKKLNSPLDRRFKSAIHFHRDSLDSGNEGLELPKQPNSHHKVTRSHCKGTPSFNDQLKFSNTEQKINVKPRILDFNLGTGSMKAVRRTVGSPKGYRSPGNNSNVSPRNMGSLTSMKGSFKW